MSQPGVDLSVIIPVYRSAGTLRELITRLVAVCDATQRTYEIVCVNDGSPDDSWDTLNALATELPPQRLIAIDLMRNFGQHNALMCGVRHSSGRLIVTMDDDLQNPPEEIPKLLQAIEESNADLIYGRYLSKQHKPWRNLGSVVVNVFYRFVFNNQITITSFRVFRRELGKSIDSYNLNFTFIDGLLAWNTQRIASVPVEHHSRGAGRSNYSLARLITLAMNLLTNFSLFPLQLVSALGLFTSLGGILTGFYYLVIYFLGHIAVPGYASLIIAVLVLGGIQMLSIGIVGEYLGRLHLNVNHKPQYTIRNIV